MRISEASTFVKTALQFNLSLGADARPTEHVITYLEGDPGLGKSAIVDQACKEIGADMMTVRLSEYEPSELLGWNIPSPDHKTMERVRPLWLPIDRPERPLVLFFDELPQGTTSCMNGVAMICNERYVGPYKLHDNMVVVCAGNPTKIRAGTNHVPTHLRDRLTYITVDANVDDTASYFASLPDFDTRLIAYLRFRPDNLSKFDKDANACPSPRSWERVNSILKFDVPEHLQYAGMSGQVGEAAATDFRAYLKLVTAVPDMDELVANPTDAKKAPIPSDPGIMYAVGAALVPRMNSKTAENIVKYLDRLPRQEIAAFVLSDSIRRDPSLKNSKPVRQWFLTKGKEYLMN